MTRRSVFVLANPEEAKNFVFHAVLERESGEKLTHTGKVHSLTEDTNLRNRTTQDAWTFNPNFVKMACGKLKYTIRIQNVFEEVKDDVAENSDIE